MNEQCFNLWLYCWHSLLLVDKRSIAWNLPQSIRIFWVLSCILYADNFTIIYATEYSQLMVQLNLNLTINTHAATQHIFISLAYMHVCAHKIDDLEALMQSTCVHTRHVHNIICISMCAYQLCTRKTWFACKLTCIWIVSQGWQNKLYEDVLVLRHDCDSHDNTKYKHDYQFLIVKLKPIYHIWWCAFYRLSLVILG